MRATRHEVTEGDLQSDAWAVAHEISGRRGHPVDFSDPADQDLVIRGVNLNNVRRGDWHMRKSVRIDEEREGEDGAIKWSERLAATSTADPLKFLLKREAAQENDAKLAASYSQAAAYVRIFARFKYNRGLNARVPGSHCRSCGRRPAVAVRWQTSNRAEVLAAARPRLCCATSTTSRLRAVGVELR